MANPKNADPKAAAAPVAEPQTPPAPDTAETDPNELAATHDYEVVSAVKVGGKWRPPGAIVSLTDELAAQLDGRVEKVED